MRFRPYDLLVVRRQKIGPEYFTVSATGVMRIKRGVQVRAGAWVRYPDRAGALVCSGRMQASGSRQAECRAGQWLEAGAKRWHCGMSWKFGQACAAQPKAVHSYGCLPSTTAQQAEFTPLAEWVREKTLFDLISAIGFFRNYLTGRCFRRWLKVRHRPKAAAHKRCYQQYGTKLRLARQGLGRGPHWGQGGHIG